MPRNRVMRSLDLQPGEPAAVAWSLFYFFCLLSSYYMLRPLRDEMGIQAGVDQLQWLFSATFVVMAGAVPLFGYASARWRRSRLVPGIYLFFALSLCGFFALFRMSPGQREVLYTSTGRKARYKAKNFIDTLVYRGGDALAGWLFAALKAAGLGLGGIALLAVPLAAAWGWLGYRLGRQAEISVAREENSNAKKTDMP